MSLTLYVDGDRWRAHLRATAQAFPGLVPVAKGNGYGFGLSRLARRATWLGVDTVAVGQYGEVPEVLPRFDGSVLVLTPWRPWNPVPDDPRVIHTVGRHTDLLALAESGLRPRVVLERMTSMRRHGFNARDLWQAARVVARTDAPASGAKCSCTRRGSPAVWATPPSRAGSSSSPAASRAA